jgi:AcrR family transcriptional regulator
MGLREMKKERTRTAILDAARELFFSRGFGNTTMEDIASAAEAAVGTVYNYFESKSAIILAITEEDTSTLLEIDLQIPPEGSSLEILSGYIEAFMKSISVYPKDLLKEMMREAWNSMDATLGKGLLQQDLTLVDRLRKILTKMQSISKLRTDLDVKHTALLIYGIVTTAIMWFAADETRTSMAMMESIDGMLRVLLRGLLPEGND